MSHFSELFGAPKKKKLPRKLPRKVVKQLKAADKAAGIPTSRRQLTKEQKALADFRSGSDGLALMGTGLPLSPGQKRGLRNTKRNARRAMR